MQNLEATPLYLEATPLYLEATPLSLFINWNAFKINQRRFELIINIIIKGGTWRTRGLRTHGESETKQGVCVCHTDFSLRRQNIAMATVATTSRRRCEVVYRHGDEGRDDHWPRGRPLTRPSL